MTDDAHECRLRTYLGYMTSIFPFKIDGGEGGGDGRTETGSGADFKNAAGQTGELDPNCSPSATIAPLGRGPSQAMDFFSARGAPSILEVNCWVTSADLTYECLAFPANLRIPPTVATDRLRGHSLKTPFVSSIFPTVAASSHFCLGYRASIEGR